jgi:isopenicillin N synthase-like dioxygenase
MTAADFDFAIIPSGGRLAELREATHCAGYFRLRHPLFPASRCAEALSLAQQFFQLPATEKERVAMEQSPHFRGYSVMHNSRDWREQIHFGREEASRHGPPYQQLRGPNLCPPDDLWRNGILSLMEDLETAARDVLAALARSLGLPGPHFLPESEVPYVLLKLIHYQALPDSTPRSGVAPHVDFSWITLLLQDDAGGLEIRGRDGSWTPFPPVSGTLLINVGEILEFATGGYFCAAPHRVVNGAQARISLPFFLNPGLDTTINAIPLPFERQTSAVVAESAATHVHRVFSEPRLARFTFGEQEWRRKGLGIYCGSCCDPGFTGSAHS